MIRLGTVVLGAVDVERAIIFWSTALGYDVVRFDDPDDEFTILRPPSGDGTRLAVQHSDEPAERHPRVHVDLVVDTADEQAAEVDRLVALGAERVAWEYPADPDFVVLADTEGNRFCIVDAGHG